MPGAAQGTPRVVAADHSRDQGIGAKTDALSVDSYESHLTGLLRPEGRSSTSVMTRSRTPFSAGGGRLGGGRDQDEGGGGLPRSKSAGSALRGVIEHPLAEGVGGS